MVANDGTLTNAAAELFCRGSDVYPRMKLGLLGGNTKAKILDLRQECGPMLDLLDLAEYFVMSNIRREFVIGETGMYRQEVPEIPADAVREAIANALCHHDYTSSIAVEINVYMDTVEILSPGRFPDGDTPEAHLSGHAGEFRLRNPNIAQALFRAGVIEQFGSGIPRIKDACDKAGVKFRYTQDDGHTAVIFNRPGSRITATGDVAEDGEIRCSAGGELPLDVFASLDEKERIAVKLIAKQGKATPRTLAMEAQTSRRTASSVLKKLAAKGILRWSGKSANDPYQFYEFAQ